MGDGQEEGSVAHAGQEATKDVTTEAGAEGVGSGNGGGVAAQEQEVVPVEGQDAE